MNSSFLNDPDSVTLNLFPGLIRSGNEMLKLSLRLMRLSRKTQHDSGHFLSWLLVSTGCNPPPYFVNIIFRTIF